MLPFCGNRPNLWALLDSRLELCRMPQNDEYRTLAANCLRMAKDTGEAGQKAMLLNMANAWLRLAHKAEKNSHSDLVYGTRDQPTLAAVQ